MHSAFRTQYEQLLASMPDQARLRLAPTPSGYLHQGNALNFFLNWQLAKASSGGNLFLRIDDLDDDRKRPEYIDDIFNTLHWLGIDWAIGPKTPDDFEDNWTQHLRIQQYVDALLQLREQGLLFACGKSRRDLAAFQGQYPVDFRQQGLSLDQPNVAWRIKTPEGFPMPDFVVRGRGGIPSYQIASLIDDLNFGITHIVRGQDLESSTKAQAYLAECLGLREQFRQITVLHHPLLMRADGEKLSKSAGAEAIRQHSSTAAPAEMVLKGFQDWLERL